MTDTLNEQRPSINTITSGTELIRWYWLKDELIEYAKNSGVKSTGAKFVILDRLAHFLDTGETLWPAEIGRGSTSNFDWHKAPLSLDTILTDSYKNTQNVRRFFHKNIGPGFKFNIAFMDWLKCNFGKTLADAIDEYNSQQVQVSKPGFKTDIKSHNQFNQYTRDILADNPGIKMVEVRRIWALKRALPSNNGRHIYERSDLDLADNQV